MRIAHLSDLHYGFSPEQDVLVARRLEDIQHTAPDHLVISGDVSQTGRSEEFAAVRDLLRRSGYDDSSRLTVIPGNHDLFSFFFKDFQAGRDLYSKWHKVPSMAGRVYRYGWPEYNADLAQFHTFFRDFFRGILTLPGASGISYPFIKLLDAQITLIALESNRLLPQIRTNMACSNGFVDLPRAEAILNHPALKNTFKIALLHHHLAAESLVSQRMGKWYAAMTRIINRAELIDLLDRSCVDLVLHGHYHHHEQYTIGKGIPVLNSGDFTRWHEVEVAGSTVKITSRP